MRIRSVLAVALMSLSLFAASAASAAEPAAAPAASVSASASMTPAISQAELLARLANHDTDVVVLDVRTAAEFDQGHVPGARNLSHELLAARLDELSSLRDKQIVLYCRSGRRTLLAEATLRQAGFTRLAHLTGDYLAWEAAGQPIERAPAPAK